MWEYSNYADLYHHGILGQKWGVRRFQNADGSLTEAGKERYGYDEFRRDAREIKRQAAEMRLNRKYKKLKGNRFVNKATLGLSLKQQIKTQWGKMVVDRTLVETAQNYTIKYDSAADKYVIKEKGSDA